MIESPHPVERTLGMEYYTTDSLGIGGMLRRQAEDFMVEELSLPVEGPGPYLVCRLTKKNWELLHLLKEIARALGISHRRISWAGTKDRHAVTTQLIAIYDVDPAMVERLSIKDVRLEVVGSSKVPLSLGMLQGNRFSLWLRECRGEELKSRVESGVGEARKGLLNYYGVQRFGARRPVTHLVGEQILFGDYESAVLTYVGRSFPDEPESARLAREEFHRTRDAGAALKNFPLHLAYERSILHHLVTNPTGFRKALAVLPPKLLSMFVSAYQSYLFNSALSARCREGTPLTTPVEGDVLVFSDGRTDRVTPRLLPAAQLQLERRRACLGLFIPGSRPEDWKTASPKACEILAERGIASDNFRKASEFTGTAFQGFHRVIGLSTDIMSKIEGNDVHLGFTLLPGQYATTVCREFMKTDPLTLI